MVLLPEEEQEVPIAVFVVAVGRTRFPSEESKV